MFISILYSRSILCTLVVIFKINGVSNKIFYVDIDQLLTKVLCICTEYIQVKYWSIWI